jgi:hypothetical protein
MISKLSMAIAAAVAGVAFSSSALAQKAYPTAEAAADALVAAVTKNDEAALKTVLGADFRKFIPPKSVDRKDVDAFLAEYAKKRSIVPDGADKAALAVGDEGWTLPVPLVKTASGWKFDVKAGVDEMRTRRIGRNELATIQAAFAYFDAQKDYARVDRNGDGVLEYAQRFISSPGKKDGLYWADPTGNDESPLGPLFGGARQGEGYHGYYYRILTGQGKDAPGGAYSYVVNGKMRNGFALVAWPIVYGDTGVMTFMISHDGQLFQKDLGHETDAAARAITRFNPDSSWTKVPPPS